MMSHKKEIDSILIIIVLIILSTINDSFAQTTKSIYVMNVSKNTKSITINEDYNKDGLEEQFSAEVIQEISKNVYWVKKAIIKNTNSTILKLDKRLEYYGKEIINQIDANYGYIIEFVGNTQIQKSLSIWLAGENGEKISDCISLDYEQNFSLLY